jgi:hypothetical protein
LFRNHSLEIPQNTIKEFLTDARYRELRKRNLQIGIGVTKRSPDRRYRAYLTEHVARRLYLPPKRCHKFGVEDCQADEAVVIHYDRL